MIVSGDEYQEAAAWAAPTYRIQMGERAKITVLLPKGESSCSLLSAHASKFRIDLTHIGIELKSQLKFASQLKCQGFARMLESAVEAEWILFVDADTCCLKPVIFGDAIVGEIGRGKIGLVPDVADRHTDRTEAPWYLPPESRTAYVNSGVILAAKASAGMFKTFEELSGNPDFLRGPFNDQKVINYALGKYYRDRLVLLDKAYNGMRLYRDGNTIIGHCAGGAGRFAGTKRKINHQRLCSSVITNS